MRPSWPWPAASTKRPVIIAVLAALAAGCAGTARSEQAGSTPSAAPSPPAASSPSGDGGVPPITPRSSSPPPPVLAGSPLSRPVSYADSVDVAVRYVAAICPFDWRQPYGIRERRGVLYLTPTRARAEAPTSAGRADWTSNVVRRRLTGTCHITAAQVLGGAPNTAARRYVNVVAQRVISENGGPPTSDLAEYTYTLRHTHNRWLIDQSSYGG